MESSGDLSKFRSKALITTSSKAKIVERLKNYWHVKSLMMQVRANPELLKDPSFQLQTMRYVQEHTELPNLTFWKKLTPEAQMKACQFFIMHEMSQTNYFHIDPSRDKAAIYVVLSGTAEVKEGLDTNEVVYNSGDIFGSTALFDEATKYPNSFNFDNLPDHLTSIENTQKAKLHKGTFMKLSLLDFHNQVLKDPAEEEQRMRDEAVKISGIPWEELTEDDKFYIRVYKRTRQLINTDLFSFLDSYKLIPKNARTPAYRFYREGIFGRELHLDPEEALSVYIIIEGGIRLDIEAHREDPEHNVHAVACKRKGKKPMVIMTRTMPILLLESGSLLFPSTECHTVGAEAEYGLGYRGARGGAGHDDDDSLSLGDMSLSTLPSVISHLPNIPPLTADRSKRLGSPPRSAAAAAAGAPLPTGTPAAGHTYGHLSFLAQPHCTSQGVPLPGHGVPPHTQQQPHNNDDAASTMMGSVASAKSRQTRQSQSDVSVLSKFSDDYNTFVAQYAARYHQPSRLNTASSTTKKAGAGSGGGEKKPPVGLYRLRAIFERETTFLKIPFSHFEKILDDSRLIVRSIADGIKRQLQRSNDTVVKRITSLLPWLTGKLTLRLQNSESTSAEEEGLNIKSSMDSDDKPKKPAIGGKLMGSYGSNILSSSMDTLLGHSKSHSASSTMGKSSASALTTSNLSRPPSQPSSLVQKNRSKVLMKNIKEQLVAKQCPPVFLTATPTGSGANKGKRRVKRSVSRDGSQDPHDATTTTTTTAAAAVAAVTGTSSNSSPKHNMNDSLATLPPHQLETVAEV